MPGDGQKKPPTPDALLASAPLPTHPCPHPILKWEAPRLSMVRGQACRQELRWECSSDIIRLERPRS